MLKRYHLIFVSQEKKSFSISRGLKRHSKNNSQGSKSVLKALFNKPQLGTENRELKAQNDAEWELTTAKCKTFIEKIQQWMLCFPRTKSLNKALVNKLQREHLSAPQLVHHPHVALAMVLLFEGTIAVVAPKLRFLTTNPLDVFIKWPFVLIAIITAGTLVRPFSFWK